MTVSIHEFSTRVILEFPWISDALAVQNSKSQHLLNRYWMGYANAGSGDPAYHLGTHSELHQGHNNEDGADHLRATAERDYESGIEISGNEMSYLNLEYNRPC